MERMECMDLVSLFPKNAQLIIYIGFDGQSVSWTRWEGVVLEQRCGNRLQHSLQRWTRRMIAFFRQSARLTRSMPLPSYNG